MKYLTMMTDDEIKYVCSIIPLQDTVRYFKQYPKEFAKIMPGFRATSLKSQKQVSYVLFKNRNQRYVSWFIENIIENWLNQIQNKISQIVDNGESKETAWLQTFSHCYFIDNIGLFFKLIGEEISEETITLLAQGISIIRDLDDNVNELEKFAKKKEQEQVRLEKKMKCVQSDLDKAKKKITYYSNEVKSLKLTNYELKRLNNVIPVKDQKIEELENEVKERKATIRQLKDNLSKVSKEQQKLEIKIREEFEKKKTTELIEQTVFPKPKCPKDMEEFRDYFSLNLENLGIEINHDYYYFLKDYICEILFTGKPILINRNTGFAFLKCVSNALVSSPTVATLVFEPNISIEVINDFLSSKNRIVCLDNFIGHFDETILFTICDRHKDKIIVLTVTYDRTLKYVPEEFLMYCNYLNINRIDAFTQTKELTEDPSTIEEIEVSDFTIVPNTKWAMLLKDILEELGVYKVLSTYFMSHIADEDSLIRILAFNILPYCVDVLNISPYDISERLNKYAGDNGRCCCKRLFRRWFT